MKGERLLIRGGTASVGSAAAATAKSVGTIVSSDDAGSRLARMRRRSSTTMSKGRMEAFTDGVIAIIITIMVLQLPLPHGDGLHALKPLVPVLLSYLMSYVYIGIYWNNHHHLLQATQHVSGGILWANLNLLFWLSLIPFATAWVGAHPLASWPVALYGSAMLFAAIAYFVLTRALIARHGKNSLLASSIGSDRKGAASLAIYLLAVVFAFVWPWAAMACYVTVLVMWFVPDRRIEKNLNAKQVNK